ncbi:MAG: Maf family protein [Candidatus Harrisonbacteria bacterium]|nr:Maf family protein [Candidatus Harrisonbacteria bacterium]
MKIILGSSSKWRKKVLEEMGYEFEAISPGIDEKMIRFDDPTKLTQALAEAKAEELKRRVKEPHILITADQVVVCRGEIREKPNDPEQAKEFLKSYAQYPPSTYSSVLVTNTANGKSAKGTDIATAYFDPIPDEVIEKLSQDEDILNSAGAFITEHPLLDPYLKGFKGTKDSVMGLPKALLKKLLGEVLDS